jgi:hypothetical protein
MSFSELVERVGEWVDIAGVALIAIGLILTTGRYLVGCGTERRQPTSATARALGAPCC